MVYTRTREQKGAGVSKILLRKARREQKGPSWTMKTTKDLDWKRDTHAHQALSSPTGSNSFTAAQTGLSTVRSKFRLIQNRTTSAFLYLLQFSPNGWIFVFSTECNKTKSETKIDFRMLDVIYFSPFIFSTVALLDSDITSLFKALVFLN